MRKQGNTSQYELQWVDLPQPLFNGSSIGAVILSPQADSTSSGRWQRDMMFCNFAAGWGSTTLQTHTAVTQLDGSVSSRVSVYQNHSEGYFATSIVDGSSKQLDNDQYQWIHSTYPQRPINITQEWAQYLDPVVKSVNRSVFDLLMQERFDVRGPGRMEAATVSATSALTLMLANGLARIGFDSTLQGYPILINSSKGTTWIDGNGTNWIDGNAWLSSKGNDFIVDPLQSQDWVKFTVSSTIQGYSYNMQTIPPRLAVAALTLYCIIALAHVFYSGFTGTLSVFPQSQIRLRTVLSEQLYVNTSN